MSQPYPPQPPQQPGAAIALTAKFFPLAFLFFFLKPFISVNGHRVPGGWGRNVIPVPPGRHLLHVHTPYLLPSKVGPTDLMVGVAPGQTLELEYRSPLLAFMKGALGTPPQKYPGMPVLIALSVLVALFWVCGLLLPIITANR